VAVDHFFGQAVRASQILDIPAVLLSPKAPRLSSPLPDHVIHVPYVDLGALLLHCALLVHHGGIGTTARAFQAGVPQIVSPVVYDQFDNAERVRRLGAGTIVERRELSGARLANVAHALLSDVGTRQRLLELKSCVTEDSISRCADLLEGISGDADC
jgi:rhamnosyltransferase subunit B